VVVPGELECTIETAEPDSAPPVWADRNVDAANADRSTEDGRGRHRAVGRAPVVRPHRRPSGSPATVAAANWRTGRGDFGVGGRTPAAHRTV